MYRILVCDDEKDIVSALKIYLMADGYQVFEAYNGREALEIFKMEDIQLVLRDSMMPERDGSTAMLKIREVSNVPVILLTAKSEDTDKVLGLTVGADDYVTKPFSMSVLVSNISAMLKRTEKAVSNIVQTGKLTFYIDEKRVVKGDNAISITPTDWKLLMAFIEHPHHILSRKQLLERLWDCNTDYVDENAVAVNIRRLREKIEPDPSNPVYIKNVRGLGYGWEMECERQ